MLFIQFHHFTEHEYLDVRGIIWAFVGVLYSGTWWNLFISPRLKVRSEKQRDLQFDSSIHTPWPSFPSQVSVTFPSARGSNAPRKRSMFLSATYARELKVDPIQDGTGKE